VANASGSIVFGEKQNRVGDFFMDMLENGGDPGNGMEHGCHSSVSLKGRGSNFAFADGSARFFKYGTAVWPLNLWAVSDEDRLKYAFQAQ
jgi:prepilin-type processing-associated H-X9-DG protein